ncbi:MAG TPA: hypothetical protein VFD21_10425 [Vicinamibacterales bacterium]|nr:hypothetical protein [Vicinamibacterales bacterium]
MASTTAGRCIRKSAAIIAIVFSVCAGVGFSGQLHPYRDAASVCVRLTERDYLSGSTLKTLEDEASRIWIRHGIQLSWTQPVPEACPTVVSLVFDESELLRLAHGFRDSALARTVFLGRLQTIYVSVPRAFVMLAQVTQQNKTLGSGGERDFRGGTLLGRVVAHELGHVLLTTLSHSETGLMRPVFGLKDVLSDEDQTITLSSQQTDRLEMRFTLVRVGSPGQRLPSLLARSEMSK